MIQAQFFLHLLVALFHRPPALPEANCPDATRVGRQVREGVLDRAVFAPLDQEPDRFRSQLPLAIAATILSIGFAGAIGLVRVACIPNPFIHLPEQKHIAVLPFENLGGDPSNQAFTDGLVESLTSKLSQLERYQKSFWIALLRTAER